MGFRRRIATEDSLTVKLHGLRDDRTYELEEIDTKKKHSISGKELAAGIRLHVPAAPGSTLMIYREVK